MSEEHSTNDARFTDGGLVDSGNKMDQMYKSIFFCLSFPDLRDSFQSSKTSDVVSIGKPDNQLSTCQAFPATNSVILNGEKDHF